MLLDDANLRGVLILDLKIHHVFFNEKGNYCLKFRIESSRGDIRQVKLYINETEDSIFEYEFTSKACFQGDLDIPCYLDHSMFRFEMPEEFSNGEVVLFFECFHFTENPLEEPAKCGEGKFLVFPYASVVPIDELPSTSSGIVTCYGYTTQIAINNILTEEQLYVNVANVQASVSLKICQGSERQYSFSHVMYKKPVHNSLISTETWERSAKNLHHSISSNHTLNVVKRDSTSQTCTADDLGEILSRQREFEKSVNGRKNENRKFHVAEKVVIEKSANLFTSSSEHERLNDITEIVAKNEVEDLEFEEEDLGLLYQGNAVHTRATNDNNGMKKNNVVDDVMLPRSGNEPSLTHICGSHMTDHQMCEIVVHVHSACDLTSIKQGLPPQPYVTCNIKEKYSKEINNFNATHTTQHPTYSPYWDELIVINTSKQNFSNEELVINIIDHSRRSLIVNYCLPLRLFQPFYPYHLELEQAETENKAAKLFLTLMIKLDELLPPSLYSETFGLEVVLRQFTSFLAYGSTDPLIASIRIVSECDHYRKRYLNGNRMDRGVETIKLKMPIKTFPESIKDKSPFEITQVTFAAKSSEQQKWNQMFFFSGDYHLLFSSRSALVIEYFNTRQAVSFGRWQPRSPIGHSIIDLDDQLGEVLKRENATMGVCLDNIAVNECFLNEQFGNEVKVNMILRLITNKRPDPMLPETQFSILPSVDMATEHPPSLPQTVGTSKQLPKLNDHYTAPIPDTGTSTLSVMGNQAKELEKHRIAMKEMANDLLKLKSEATRLQAENSRLRLLLNYRHESSMMAPLAQLENTTQAELVQRIVIVKGSLDEQIAMNRELKLDIRSLQNQLIKKNEREKELYKLQEAHRNQQMLLQKMQERLRRNKTLEETCKRQEKVILRLEDLLAISKIKDDDKTNYDEQIKTEKSTVTGTLLDENKRLRTLLLNYEETKTTVEDLERFQTQQKLRRAEVRVAALERELMDYTRKWPKDKAELQTPTPESFLHRSRMTSPKLSPLTRDDALKK